MADFCITSKTATNLTMSDNWKAIEANPQVLNNYVNALGFDTDQFIFNDLYSIEDWAKDMITKPVIGLLLVFPVTDNVKEYKAKEEQEILEKGQKVDNDLFFMKQYAPNACGTIGIYHILANLQDEHALLLKEDSIVRQFVNDTKNTDTEERGKVFLNSDAIKGVHKDQVEKGQSQVQNQVDHHFVAFINFNNSLYELDGTKKFPINHGDTNKENFFDDACKAVKGFMERDPDNIGFSLVVLNRKA